MKVVILLELNGVEGIESALDRINSFKPKKYISNKEIFIEKLENVINS